MAITIPNTFVDASIAQASEVNGNFDAVKNFVDSLQAGTGFTAGAIPAAALASDSVTAIKILNGVVSYAKLDADVSTNLSVNDQIVLGSQIFS
jgi:hypothetical protein